MEVRKIKSIEKRKRKKEQEKMEGGIRITKGG